MSGLPECLDCGGTIGLHRAQTMIAGRWLTADLCLDKRECLQRRARAALANPYLAVDAQADRERRALLAAHTGREEGEERNG